VRGSAQTRFEAFLDVLPIRKPPLPIQQYMSAEGSARLVARPRARDFFCGWDIATRKAAIEAFYRQAVRVARAARVRGFSLVVDALRETGDVRPLAYGRHGSVTLTRRGRKRGSC